MHVSRYDAFIAQKAKKAALEAHKAHLAREAELRRSQQTEKPVPAISQVSRKRKYSDGVSSSSSTSSASSTSSIVHQPAEAKKPRVDLEDLLQKKRTVPAAFCPRAKEPTKMELNMRERKVAEEANRKIQERSREHTLNSIKEYRLQQFKKAQEAKKTGIFEGEQAPKKKKTTRARKQSWERYY
uniref:Ribosomal RNA-processing protein n=1 Tax=Caenorhabditis tropicalis TaxID=1561998 RepID=A0A1I7U4U1_9PELO